MLKEKLYIYSFADGQYFESIQSRYFPEYNLQKLVAETLQTAYEQNTSMAIRRLRSLLQ
ncbi:hypothetical protein [Leptolyngbya sp. FACHB-1515]